MCDLIVVACWGEMFSEKRVGKSARLWEAVNCATHFKINVAIDGKGVQIILVSDMLRENI